MMKHKNKRPRVKPMGANTLNTFLFCHVELCETSRVKKIEILHCVQNDRVGLRDRFHNVMFLSVLS